MTAIIDANAVNDILFPSYRGALGFIVGAERAAQDILDARNYGQLKSDVFSFDVRDAAKNQVSTFNGATMIVKAAYNGSKTDLASINVVMANWGLTTIETLPAADLLMIQPAVSEDTELNPIEGYVIFKTTQPGYFLIADK